MTTSRWAAIAAILFAVFFVLGMIMPGDTPQSDASDQEFVDYYSDGANQKQLVASAYFETAAAIALVVVASILFRSDSGRSLAAIARGSAQLAAIAFSVGSVALAAVAATAAFDDIPPDPDAARFFPGIGYGTMLIVGGLAAAAMITAISAEWHLSKAMPRWISWFGLVCAAALLFGIVFLPMAALPLWAIVVAVTILVRGTTVPTRSA